MKPQLDFIHLSPAIELMNYHEKISRKISRIDKRLDGHKKKSSSLLRERDQLVDIQSVIDSCLNGADVSVWAAIAQVQHLLN